MSKGMNADDQGAGGTELKHGGGALGVGVSWAYGKTVKGQNDGMRRQAKEVQRKTTWRTSKSKQPPQTNT